VIVTVTLNAALDVGYEVEGVAWDGLNRVRAPRYRAAGRGVTVARVLHTFGHEVTAAGLAGGATGELIRADLARSGVPTGFTLTGRESRRVLWVTDTKQGTTACFREPAPYITTEELGRFAADYRRLVKDATGVVLCGSLAAGLPPEIYGTLATYAADVGVPVILHASGSALRLGMARRPALVVPDHRAAARVGNRASHPQDLIAAGVGAVVMPSEGQVLAVSARGAWRARLPYPDADSLAAADRTAAADPLAPAAADPLAPAPLPVSAGPLLAGAAWSGGVRGALVAGLVPGTLLGWPWPDRLKHALALAAAADHAGSIDIAAYEQFIAQVIVEPA
jgi:fructose-1-phosphate kinase PfkB-like protein